MKRAQQFPVNLLFVPLFFLVVSMAGCDTTPRERREIANQEIDKLDERAEDLAGKTKAEAKEVKEALARQKAERKEREARGLVPGKMSQIEQELLGDYQNLSSVSPENLRDAYVHFLQQVRDRKDNWTLEDWDYANALYKRLNEREKQLHDDIILRHATKIKALQAEYLALENRADLKDYQRIKQDQAN